MSDEVEVTGGSPVESNGDDDGHDTKDWKPTDDRNNTSLMRQHLGAVCLMEEQDVRRAAYREMLDAEGARETERVMGPDGTTRNLLPPSQARKWLTIENFPTPGRLAEPKYTITIDKAFTDPKELYKRPGRIIPVYGRPPVKSIWRNRSGCLWFNFKRQYFIFNEGGHGVTLTIASVLPFRLYVAGYVLMYRKGWTFKRLK